MRGGWFDLRGVILDCLNAVAIKTHQSWSRGNYYNPIIRKIFKTRLAMVKRLQGFNVQLWAMIHCKLLRYLILAFTIIINWSEHLKVIIFTPNIINALSYSSSDYCVYFLNCFPFLELTTIEAWINYCYDSVRKIKKHVGIYVRRDAHCFYFHLGEVLKVLQALSKQFCCGNGHCLIFILWTNSFWW